MADLDLVSKLSVEDRARRESSMKCISPDDAKYADASEKLKGYLSADAEWGECARIQLVLLETRREFGQAEERHVDEVRAALQNVSPLNMALLEEKVTRHDQLAVIEEIGRFVSAETKALLHPGTTSYDILDSARSRLFMGAWRDVIRPEIARAINKLCVMAMEAKDMLQVGRTHLQHTSPVPLGLTLSIYAARLAERVERCDYAFSELRGKISGIVGTGASIEMVIGEGKSLEFEAEVLKKLGLKPDRTATQIVQKERLADAGHCLTTLMHVLADFTNDIRMLYSSEIGEVTARDNAERLGGSSADATKNNPVDWENMTGKATVVESGMRILYEMIHSDLQRDLRGSVMARYQPQQMMTEVYEAFRRLNKALPQLSFNEDRMAANLEDIKQNPSEAMVAILRGEGWVHSKYGGGHDFVREMGKRAKKEGRSLFGVCDEDSEFDRLYSELPQSKRDILEGKLEKYVGQSEGRLRENVSYASAVAHKREGD